MNQEENDAWKTTSVSVCETFHILEGKPLYARSFKNVIKFHSPGLAPVLDESGAYHINIDGLPAYKDRFRRTFGFYQNIAAVETDKGCFHIHPNGSRVYLEGYLWCGNFQEGFCSVKEKKSHFFHIDKGGHRIYPENYSYVGDFKDGIAVVFSNSGAQTHIDTQGRYIHCQWFRQLDVFHKGFARARDEKGWFHINKLGVLIYPERYKAVEPFYNGVSVVEDFDGALKQINEQGVILNVIHAPEKSYIASLSSDMTGYWKTFTIYHAVQLKILDTLPNNVLAISETTEINMEYCTRLLRALWELGITTVKEGVWQLTQKGQLLTPTSSPLASAAKMWVDFHLDHWKNLGGLLKNEKAKPPDFFQKLGDQKMDVLLYHQAIEGYAKEDYPQCISSIDWTNYQIIADVGGGNGALLSCLLNTCPSVQGILFDKPEVISRTQFSSDIDKRVELVQGDFFKRFSFNADAVILARILHDWDDNKAKKILENTATALSSKGSLFIFEMIQDENTPFGALLDLHMLAATGGKERNFNQWNQLLNSCKFSIVNVQKISDILSVIHCSKL